MTARSFTDVEYNYKKINEDIAEARERISPFSRQPRP